VLTGAWFDSQPNLKTEPNFVIIAYDHNDADAFERRMQVPGPFIF